MTTAEKMLKKIQKHYQLEIIDLAKLIGVSDTVIYNWLVNGMNPNSKNLLKIVNIYNEVLEKEAKTKGNKNKKLANQLNNVYLDLLQTEPKRGSGYYLDRAIRNLKAIVDKIS